MTTSNRDIVINAAIGTFGAAASGAMATTWRQTSRGSALLLIALTSLAACGTADGGVTAGGTSVETSCVSGVNGVDCFAKLEVRDKGTGQNQVNGSQFVVPVGNVKTGEKLPLSFSISNTANLAFSAILEVRSIRIVYEPTSPEESAGDAFECFGPDGTTHCADMAGKWSPIVPAGASNVGWVNAESFVISYKRYDDKPRIANVFIKVAGDKDFYTKEFLLRFSTKAGSPKINVPNLIEFGQVEPEKSADKVFKVLNTGDAVLEIKKLDFLADNVFKVKTKLLDGTAKEWGPGEPIVLEPALAIASSASHEFTVTFSPKDPNKKQGTLTFVSNDPTPKSGEVPIIANAKVPCMQLDPAGKLSFGGVKLGDKGIRDVHIKACGGADLIVTKIEFGDSGNSTEFSFDFTKLGGKFNAATGPAKDNELIIKQNDEAIFEVIYTPDDESPLDPETDVPKLDIAEVRVISNAFSAKNTLICEGIGVTTTCPDAKVTIQEGEEVIPQTVLHLKGDQSKATGGSSIKKYKWTAKQPSGSNQPFVPGSNFPNPTFTANAAGEYEFCLEVWDDTDQKSCAPACITVLVIPEEAIHVELLWNTPADLNQTDTGPAAGADMDLHFAHYLAGGPDIDCDGKPDPWFSNPFDTFWFNPNPNWGNSGGTANDDPSLDLDDTDGAGPENLNLADPEGTAAKTAYYHVGVHYWNDHGFGASQATVNVYIFGVLAVQIDKVEMDVLDMWYVGKINWPNKITDKAAANVVPVEICYQNGDPCKGGKRWVPKGDWCITKCYSNPAFTATQSGANPANCSTAP